MKLPQFLFFIFISIVSSNLAAQSTTDTIPFKNIRQLTKLEDLYKLPGDKDSLDHFVAFITLPGTDPVAAYNKGSDFIPNTIEIINQLTPGSKLSILVYAINTDHPEMGPVKLLRKDFFIK